MITKEPNDRKTSEDGEKWQDDLLVVDRGFGDYYLIDGQQRLTTSIILINELLSKFSEDEGINFNSKKDWLKKFLFQTYNESYKSYIFGYEKDNPSDEYFKTRILNQESSTSDKVPEQTLYNANLIRAKEYFSGELSKLNEEDLQSIFKKITSKFKYNLSLLSR